MGFKATMLKATIKTAILTYIKRLLLIVSKLLKELFVRVTLKKQIYRKTNYIASIQLSPFLRNCLPSSKNTYILLFFFQSSPSSIFTDFCIFVMHLRFTDTTRPTSFLFPINRQAARLVNFKIVLHYFSLFKIGVQTFFYI